MKFNIKLFKIQYVDIIIFMLSIICLGGSGVFKSVRTPFIFLLTVILIFGMLLRQTTFTKDFLLWMVWFGVMGLTSFFSYDFSSSWSYLGIYLCGILLANYYFSNEKQELVLKIIKVVCSIIAVSVILAFLIPSFMTTFWFTVGIHKESVLAFITKEQLLIKAYAGFGGERSETAFLMNIGIAVVLASKSKKMSKKAKLIDNVALFIMFLALLLTGKRTLLVIAIFLFFIWFFISGNAKDKIKYILAGVIAFVLLLYVAQYFPVIQHTLERFVISDGDDITNGRSTLWAYAFDMFEDRPILGGGLGSYNEYAYQNGYLHKGVRWQYHCHNIYIQALGEMGILGFGVWIFLLGKSLLRTIFIYHNIVEESCKRIILASAFLQCIILIYGLTGNCMYYDNQLMLYFVALCLMNSVKRVARVE